MVKVVIECNDMEDAIQIANSYKNFVYIGMINRWNPKYPTMIVDAEKTTVDVDFNSGIINVKFNTNG